MPVRVDPLFPTGDQGEELIAHVEEGHHRAPRLILMAPRSSNENTAR